MNMAYARMGAVAHALGSQSQDPTLQAIDHRLFGQPLPLVFDAWVTPLASDLLSACYVLFFPYLLVSCARQVWRAGTDLEQAQRFHAGVFSVYAAGFIGYLLMPAAGPYLAMPDAFSHTITGGWMTALNDAIVRRGSNHVDVFPSLHVAVSAFLLGFDRTYARRRFRAYCIPAVGLWVSTLYLRYHYGIDVAAGFALAAVGLWLAYRAPSLGAIETTQATTDTTPAPAGSVVLPVPLSRRRARLPSPLTSPMPFLYRFSDPAVCDVAIGGGKGANLAKLTQAGAPVPPGAVVTDGAYRAFLAPVLPQIAALVTGVASTDHARTAAIEAAVLELTMTLPMPTRLADEVRAFMTDAPADTRWAVRSSGTAEDTATAAFAGLHDTFLNCTTVEDVLSHVRRCWLSLWSARAIAYRAQFGISHTDATMAVVLQHMVMAEAAGVGFSINVVNGRLDQVMLSANFGIGESVVSGEGEVDHLIVDKATGRIVEAFIAHKTTRVEAAPEGGTIERHVDDASADAPVLTDAQAGALVQLLMRLERHFGWPQDAEWALCDGTLFLLQSRPVTTIPARWTRDESAERFPNPVTPFTWDFVEAGFHRSLNHSFALMGLPPFPGQWFGRFGNYIYGNQNAVELYAHQSPVPPVESLSDLAQHLPALLARFAWIRELPARWHAALPVYLEAIEGFAQEPVESYTLADCADYLDRLDATGTTYFLPNIAISIGHGVLHRALVALVRLTRPEADASAVEVLVSALVRCETMTTRVNADLRALADQVRATPALGTQFRTATSVALWETGRTSAHGFWVAFRAFLAAHGHRETDFDAIHPTWADAPWVVLDQIRALLQAPVDRSIEGQRVDDAAIEREFVERELVARVPAPLQEIARGVITLARTYTALDDLEHYHTTRLSGPMRRGVLALGTRLVERGVLESPTQAFFATRAALGALIAADGTEGVEAVAAMEAFARTVRTECADYETARHTTPAWAWGVADTTDAPDTIDSRNPDRHSGKPGPGRRHRASRARSRRLRVGPSGRGPRGPNDQSSVDAALLHGRRRRHGVGQPRVARRRYGPRSQDPGGHGSPRGPHDARERRPGTRRRNHGASLSSRARGCRCLRLGSRWNAALVVAA